MSKMCSCLCRRFEAVCITLLSNFNHWYTVSMKNFCYTKDEIQLFKKLSTPAKIQDFLNTLPFNFEKNGATCMSPRRVLETRTAHCVEGAVFAAAVLEFHG